MIYVSCPYDLHVHVPFGVCYHTRTTSTYSTTKPSIRMNLDPCLSVPIPQICRCGAQGFGTIKVQRRTHDHSRVFECVWVCLRWLMRAFFWLFLLWNEWVVDVPRMYLSCVFLLYCTCTQTSTNHAAMQLLTTTW